MLPHLTYTIPLLQLPDFEYQLVNTKEVIRCIFNNFIIPFLVLSNIEYQLLLFLAPKPGYSQGVTSYTQSQQTRQVTVIKPAAPSPATSTFSIYPVTSTVQPVAAAASVVPSYSQSPTYSTNAVTYSGKLWSWIEFYLKWYENLYMCVSFFKCIYFIFNSLFASLSNAKRWQKLQINQIKNTDFENVSLTSKT